MEYGKKFKIGKAILENQGELIEFIFNSLVLTDKAPAGSYFWNGWKLLFTPKILVGRSIFNDIKRKKQRSFIWKQDEDFVRSDLPDVIRDLVSKIAKDFPDFNTSIFKKWSNYRTSDIFEPDEKGGLGYKEKMRLIINAKPDDDLSFLPNALKDRILGTGLQPPNVYLDMFFRCQVHNFLFNLLARGLGVEKKKGRALLNFTPREKKAKDKDHIHKLALETYSFLLRDNVEKQKERFLLLVCSAFKKGKVSTAADWALRFFARGVMPIKMLEEWFLIGFLSE